MAGGLTELVLHRGGRVVVTRFAAAIGVYALLFWFWLDVVGVYRLGWLEGRLYGATWLQELFQCLWWLSLKLSVYCYPVVLGGALLLTLGGYIVRSLASTRVQEGRADPLDVVRGWADRHPLLRKLPVLVPGAIFADWLSESLLHIVQGGSRFPYPTAAALAVVVVNAGSAIVMGRAVLLGMRALLAPIDRTASPPPVAEQVDFSAIALTSHTRAVTAGIAGLAAADVVGTFATFVVPVVYGDYYCREPLRWAVAVLAATTAGLFVAFRRLARVSVGIDGIRARRGAGSRFVAYRDLDAVRASGAEVELMRGERVVLRVRLHGADADRADEVAGRIRDAIAAARQQTAGGAEHVVQVESAARVATMAEGGVGYRSPAVSREQLWAVVEGASADGETRTAAARALAVTMRDDDRPRMRAVATRVADPRLRVALDALVAEEDVPVLAPAPPHAVTRG